MMTLNLIKYITALGPRFRHSGDICSVVWRNNEYCLFVAVHRTLSKRFVEYQAFSDNKVDDKIPIPIVRENDKPKKSVTESFNVITSDDIAIIKKEETGILDPCEEDVSDIAPFALPSFSLAAYVNSSYTLQEFVKMGVKLHEIDRKKGAAELLLKLDFEKHVKPHIRFLHDVGVPAEELGEFVTKNPFIFEQNLDDLQVRINYLEAKKFTSEAISRIVTKAPLWLNFSTVDIDKRLGFVQRLFTLSGDEVRTLTAKRPQLITYSLHKVTVSHFAVKEEMGFDDVQTKTMLLLSPKLFTLSTKALKSRFDLVHNIMGISHEQILQQPEVLLTREFIIKQRHEFLQELGKAQYDPKLPNYVSLKTLVVGSDVDFCRNVAKTSIDVFNAFLKSR